MVVVVVMGVLAVAAVAAPAEAVVGATIAARPGSKRATIAAILALAVYPNNVSIQVFHLQSLEFWSSVLLERRTRHFEGFLHMA